MKKIGLILVLGLAIRLIGLNQSLWQDEAISANITESLSYGQILSEYSPADFHPPLYYFLLKTWGTVFGFSEISLRLPSVIFGILTVYFVYLLAGEWGALLTAVNPLLIYYSQEVRMYSMATFLVIAGLYSWQKKKYLWVNILAFLSFLTFYGVIFFWGALGLYLLWQKKYKEILKCFWGLLAAIVLVYPLLATQIKYSRGAIVGIFGWSAALGKVTLKNLLLFPVKFSVGRISFYPKVLYWAVTGIWSAVVSLGVFLGVRKNRTAGVLLVLPVALGVIFSLVSPLLSYFRFLYLVPIFAILLAESKLRKVAFLGFMGFSLLYVLVSDFHREDWKSLAKDLKAEETVYMIPEAADPLKYYQPQIKVADLRQTDAGEIKVIPFSANIYLGNYREYLQNKGYSIESGKSYRELSVEVWKLKAN